MGRPKKQHLKRRKDGRYKATYHGMQFMGNTEEEALKARDDFKRLEVNGLSQIMTVSAYAENWFPIAYPEGSVSDKTRKDLSIHIKKLLRVIGDDNLDSITPIRIKEVYSTEYVGLSSDYISHGKSLFCALFDSAVADGYLRTNPARSATAKPHKGTFEGHRAISPQERNWIRTLCTDHRAHACVMAMLYAGLRPQEAKALIIDKSVDFDNNQITLTDFAHLDGLYNYKITSVGKTDNAARTIPLFPPLKKALQGKAGYLITDADGNRVTIQAWRRVWESYVFHMEKAINGCEKRWYGKTKEHKAMIARGESLPPWIPFTVLPYDLRHSFCTMCRDNGVEMNTCVQWMGHSDATMIMRVYDEVTDNRNKREAERLSNILSEEEGLE